MAVDSPLSLLSLAPGTRLGDRYRIEAVIGEGGMGIVLAAFDERLARRVALKLLDPKRSASPLRCHRFLREARAVAMLESEHVVRVYDAGVFDGAGAYLAMERLEGTDLRKALRGRDRLAPDEAVEILVQTCRAVAAAHAGGIIHRDLKPANIFLVHSVDGTRVKVLDFGISKITSEQDTESSLTDTGSALGSPRYMSPEQVRDAKRVGPASDIWALGVILYELLAGTTPFVADTAPGVYAQIIADPPPPLRDLRADVPSALEAICMRCLQKRPEHRYRDVATLARALASFARGDGETKEAGGTTDHQTDVSEVTLDPVNPERTSRHSVEPTTPPLARKRYLAIGMAAAVVVALTPFVVSSRTVGATPRALSMASGVTEVTAQDSLRLPSVPLEALPNAGSAEAERGAAPRWLVAPPPSTPPPRVRERSVQSAATTSACDPPFVIDPTTGTRRVKPGC